MVTLFDLVMEFEGYKSAEIPLGKSESTPPRPRFVFYDYFARFFGIKSPFKATTDNLYKRIIDESLEAAGKKALTESVKEFIDRMYGRVSPLRPREQTVEAPQNEVFYPVTEQDFQAVLHYIMGNVDSLLPQMEIYQLSYLLEPPTPGINDKNGHFAAGVIQRAIQLHPQEESSYRSIAAKATSIRRTKAEVELVTLKEKLTSAEGYPTLAEFQSWGKMWYEELTKITVEKEDNELLAVAKRRAVHNNLRSIIQQEIKADDYREMTVERARLDRDYTHSLLGEPSIHRWSERIGIKYTPFEEALEVLNASRKDTSIRSDDGTPIGLDTRLDLDPELLQDLLTYQTGIAAFYDKSPILKQEAKGKIYPLLVSSENNRNYQLLRRAWQEAGFIPNTGT